MEHAQFKELPLFTFVDKQMVTENYQQIKKDIAMIIENEIEVLMNTLF